MPVSRFATLHIWLILVTVIIAFASQSSANLSAAGRPPVESDKLPWCDPALFAKPIESDKLPAPDVNADPVCKIKNTVHAVPPGQQPNGNTFGGMATNPSIASGESVTATNVYAWAIHKLSCKYSGSGCSTSSSGVTEAYFNVSTQTPTLSSGSWTAFHYANRVHFSQPAYAASCGGVIESTFSVGYGQGQIWTTNFSNRIFSEMYGPNASGTMICNAYDSGVAVTGPGALTIHISRSSSNWLIDIWLGYWARVNTFNTTWAVAPEMDAGQEIWAQNGDFSPLTVPVNFIHKLEIAGSSNSMRPWSDAVLVAPLKGITQDISQSPLQVMDLFGGDFTSEASHK